ncbi:protein MNN4-like [Cucumis melo var. makuwa]|uniref:Protein MNN4-like n=1 Tax=Cucumis melo var. makuwa TaxID=1194695 RepID=A0A5D3BYP6_CUCMM|nr:protein MNN4-like [Cucumis melo var. makuwa]
MKVKAHGVKALVQEKKETKLRKREELLSKVEKVTLSTNKGKGKEKTFDEHCPRGTHQNVQMKRFFQPVIAIRQDVVKMFFKGYINEEEHYAMVEVKVGIWSSSIVHRIISIYKNKAKLKRLKTKPNGKLEVKEVDGEDKEEKKENDIPLKRKRQGEEEASRSKKLKTSTARDSKETLSPASTKSPKNKKKSTDLPSPNKSKSSKATGSQTPIKFKTPPPPLKKFKSPTLS